MTYDELKKKQIGGSHYKKIDPQPWDFYRGFMSRKAWVGYLKGNIIDYLVRDKNGLEDLKKAQHLMDVLVATEEEMEQHPIKIVDICPLCGGQEHRGWCLRCEIDEDRM